MGTIGALVEGQTEEQFIKIVLAPFLQRRNIFVEPIVIKTKVTKQGKHFKGGINSYAQVERDLRKLPPKKYSYVTTMFDVYQLPEDFPGYKEAQRYRQSPHKYVEVLEREFAKDIDRERFIPYLSLHEFEALLFAAPEQIIDRLSGIDAAKIEKIVEQFPTPEDINHDAPPSKRLAALYRSYGKVRHGIMIVKEVGIERLRATCPHFNQWVNQLETI